MSNVTPFPITSLRETNREADREVATVSGTASDRTFHFWRGASNRRYVHIVYNLIDCPELKASNYILVRVEGGGRRIPLKIDRTTSEHGFENLAEIRKHAARLRATEVHLHVLGDTPHAQAITQWDLQAANFGDIVSEGLNEALCGTVRA